MKQYLKDIVKCVKCGRCRTVCPSQNVLGWESSGPRGRMLMAQGCTCDLEMSQGMIDGFLTCTTCHQCVSECPSGADPLEITRVVRRELIDMGHVAPHQIEIMKRVSGSGNSLGDESPRTSWLDIPVDAGSFDHIYFVGCLASYRQQETTAAIYSILRQFSVGLLEDEKCCGSPLYRLGLDTSELIEHNSYQIKKAGAHTVITECAGCYAMFKGQYEFNVIHLSEFLSDRLEQLPLKRLNITVSYHDPCHLGRFNKLYDAPRIVINHICTLVEMKYSREKAGCCGGGGGVRLGYPELSSMVAKDLAANIPQGMDYVVTACPLCIRNLSDIGIKTIDLAELVRMSMV
jgi:Fe-S oxidoreductase